MSTGIDPITLIFLVAAVLVILRLRSVLGRRTGHERPPPKPYSRGEQRGPVPANKDNVVSLPNRSESGLAGSNEVGRDQLGIQEGSQLDQALMRIALVDRAFDPARFLEGAKKAHEQIVIAFAEGNLGALRKLLSDDVFINFRRAIRDRESAGQKLEFEFETLKGAEITDAVLDDSTASLTVKFQSVIRQCIRSRDGEVVSGDPAIARDVIDVWTFTRDLKSSDPNWQLAATDTEH